MKVGVALVGLLFLGACGPTTKTVVEAAPTVPPVDSTLDVGDTFDVRVYGEPDLTGTFRVGAEGAITFPLVGIIKVQGLEPQEVSRRLAQRLSEGILRNPQVTVMVKEQTSKKIIIIGQVAKPGTFTFTPSMSVVEAITVAGGFTALAAKNDTTITRTDSGKKTIVKVPVEEIGEGKARNVYLRPGDIINVPERLF